MIFAHPRVVVIGAGITGAAVAWRLARRGVDVTVVDRHARSAGGVTRWSYGWIGTGSRWPAEDLSRFALEARALADFRRFEEELGPLPVAARGAIVWSGSEAETASFIGAQRAAGRLAEALAADRVMLLEPHLAQAPSLAAWLPDEIAVEPTDLTASLLRAATEDGCRTLYDTTVSHIVSDHGRVAGVATDRGVLATDIVVLAGGSGAVPLAAAFGAVLPIREEPAVLLRFASDPCGPRHIIYGDGLELRSTLSGEMVSAEDYPKEGLAGLAALASRTADKIADLFMLCKRPELLSANAACRPMTADGTPLCKFLSELDGVYVVVAHPGVMLAPRLSQQAADDILRH